MKKVGEGPPLLNTALIDLQVRNYLWRQPLILRFNEDGKKAKSKGNHIWNVEAKKLGDGLWEFRPFHRKIAGNPPGLAYTGLLWKWQPRIWDPQACWQNIPVQYSSPSLPPWLQWKDDVLSGTPPPTAENCEITAHAKVGFSSLHRDYTLTPLFSSPSTGKRGILVVRFH
jgi:hypothetical protein